MDRDHLSHSPTPARARDAVAPAGPTAAAQTGTAPARVGAALCWLIAALACAWIAWCTAIGPLMRADAGLAAFRWTNGVAFVAMFVVCFGIVWLLVRSAWIAWCTAIGPLMRADAGLAAFRWTNGVAFVAMFVVCFGIVWLLVRSAHRAADSATRTTASLGGAADSTAHIAGPTPAAHLAGRTIALPPRAARFFAAAGRLTVRATRNWRRIWLVLAIGWLWIPTTLLVAYGADILSQTREFAWAWNQWTGLEQPYIGFFSFVPMDIYPTSRTSASSRSCRWTSTPPRITCGPPTPRT